MNGYFSYYQYHPFFFSLLQTIFINFFANVGAAALNASSRDLEAIPANTPAPAKNYGCPCEKKYSVIATAKNILITTKTIVNTAIPLVIRHHY